MHDESGGTDSINGGGASKTASDDKGNQALITVDLVPDYHRCDQFVCSKSARVERFLRADRIKLAGPRLANIYVMPNPEDDRDILGYYCLSAGQLERDSVSNKLRREIPRSTIPMAMLGFMGRDDRAPSGTGILLLADAANRLSRRQDMGFWGIMLHAENDALVAWYTDKGFKLTPQEGVPEHNKRLMYAPLASLIP